MVMKRKEVQKHEPECSYRTVSCNFCAEELPHIELEDHYEDCPEYPVDCPNCKLRVEARHGLDSHISYDCPLVWITCRICKTEKVYRKDLQHHEANCRYRNVKCELCNLMLRFFFELQQHHGKCPRVLVECPNGCGCEPMQRRMLRSHEETCPNVIIGCKFPDCVAQVKRGDMQVHMKEATVDHLWLVCAQIKERDKVIDELKQQLEQRDEVITKMKEKRKRDKQAVKKVAETSISLMVHGPYHINAVFKGERKSFFTTDIEWAVAVGCDSGGRTGVRITFQESKNGSVGANVSFTLTIDGNTINADGDAIIELSSEFYYAQGLMRYTSYEVVISKFKVNSLIWD